MFLNNVQRERMRWHLNTIGFALADENVDNHTARRAAVLAHQVLLNMFEDELDPPRSPGGEQATVDNKAASDRITKAIQTVADIVGVDMLPGRNGIVDLKTGALVDE